MASRTLLGNEGASTIQIKGGTNYGNWVVMSMIPQHWCIFDK
jgi:hypothetical protein